MKRKVFLGSALIGLLALAIIASTSIASGSVFAQTGYDHGADHARTTGYDHGAHEAAAHGANH